ncbi:MAG: hypothetical protein ACTHJ7_03175 [Candidatus Nitrosocosmicus sp.]
MSLNNKKSIILKTLLLVIPLFLGLILEQDNIIAKKTKTQKHIHIEQYKRIGQSSNQNLKCEHNFNVQITCSNVNSQRAENSGYSQITPNNVGSGSSFDEINPNAPSFYGGLFKQFAGQEQSSNQNLKCEHNFNVQITCSNVNSQRAIDLGDNLIE